MPVSDMFQRIKKIVHATFLICFERFFQYSDPLPPHIFAEFIASHRLSHHIPAQQTLKNSISHTDTTFPSDVFAVKYSSFYIINV